MHIFRAYDIRGKLTPQMVEAIAHAFASHLNQNKIKQLVLGYDARLSSPQYAYIIQTTLEKAGIEVEALGCCSTPLMYFYAQKHGNGIMLTASHNPSTDQGIKWLLNGLPPTPEDIQHIGQLTQQYLDPSKGGYPTIQPATSKKHAKAYCDYLIQDIHLKRPLKVVVDGLHGSAGQYVEPVFKGLKCEVITLRCEANGQFPDHAPDPSKAKHLEKLQHAVLEHQADVGLALDGDGDRLVLVDEKANIINADQLLCFLAEQCLKQHPHQQIVYDVKCSSLVKDTILKAQGTPVMLRTGSTFLRRYLIQHNALFGGEYAGHYAFNDGRGKAYDDGLYAGLRVLEYFTHTNVNNISELFNDLQRASTEDIYIHASVEQIQKTLASIEQKAHQLDATLTQIDGIRLDFTDGFGLIRASNTGEYLTLRFDAKDEHALKNIQTQLIALVDDDLAQKMTEELS